jgi:hypothetical protein
VVLCWLLFYVGEYSTISVRKASHITSQVLTIMNYSYQYKIAEHISIGRGYLEGDSSKVDGIIIDVFTDSKIDYGAFLSSTAVNIPISKRIFLYLKVNALQYDYDIIDDNEVVFNQ